MSDLNSGTWHQLDSANTDAPPDGWPEGQPANSVNNCARAGMGALKRFYDRINATLTSGGSGNAQTLVYTVAPTALVKGDCFSFFAGFTNTGAVTLNVGVGGAVPIRVGAAALSAGSITAGDAVSVMYDGTNFQFTGWEPSRTTGQNLTVSTLTATAGGTSVTLSAGSLSVAGNATVAGNIQGLNITATSSLIAGGSLAIGGSYILMAGNTNNAVGPLYYADTTNSLIRIGPGGGSLLIQNNAQANNHVFTAAGAASHATSLAVGTSATVGTSLAVGSTLSVASTATVSGVLNVTGSITTNGNLTANGGALFMGGVTVIGGNVLNTGYTVINDNANRNSIFMGSGDPTNYYRQTTHLFQSQAGGANYLQLSPGSFHSYVNATFDGTITTGGAITSSQNGIVSNGSAASLGFADRSGGVQWLWYSTSNIARLWESAHGDRVTVDTGGSLTANGYLASSANVYCNGTGITFQNIGANGFNFRWDGGHIFGRVDNAVEYPLYNANGGTISGSVTTTGNLQVNGTINCNSTVNATDYYCSGIRSMTAGGGFVQIFDLNTGLASILCGSSVIGINYNIQMSNNIAISAHESGGTVRNMLLLNSSNNLIVGNTATAVVDIESGGNVSVTATGNFVVSNNDAYKPGGGSWQAISDVRVKEDIKDYEVGLEALKLRPVTYKLNGKGGTVADGREYIGLVADEVEPIMPEMVGRLDDDELGEIKTLDSSALTFALLNVCKKLEARLAALEAK